MSQERPAKTPVILLCRSWWSGLHGIRPIVPPTTWRGRARTDAPSGKPGIRRYPPRIFSCGPVPLITPRLIVGLGPPSREDLPCPPEVGARLLEGGARAGRALTRLRSRIKSAAPAPWGLVVRDAGSDREGADIDVAEIDQPAFITSVLIAAAGEDGNGRDDSANLAPREAVNQAAAHQRPNGTTSAICWFWLLSVVTDFAISQRKQDVGGSFFGL